ncbi:isovaleryl-CoA dehydrogenase [Salinarimonas rosea]|uniref:isovaleryl-CoA dehydrogenase n=1 Tax=Salinarimonas rosea TaxID=552063 RepID=UPI0004295D69|nr:isovaleryl-CoA dehydrogenase [Salinarimonas rosea]
MTSETTSDIRQEPLAGSDAAAPPLAELATHAVTNQPPPFGPRDLFASDPAFRDAALRATGAWAEPALAALGRAAGSDAVREAGVLANRHPPELVTFDRYGRRLDEVRFHPSYHALMRLAMEHRIHDVAWARAAAGEGGGHALHAALLALFTQAEAGVMCPISMTYASVPALRRQPEVAQAWLDRLIGGRYDPVLRPASEKAGVTLGMAMTEKQGGSDVRANATRAEPAGAGGPSADYRLTGHKWFCSAPMSDAFLTLAVAPGGLSCLLVPRVLPDGTRNAIHVMRLKDKLGNRSNASSEIEYHGAHAVLIGAEGEGVRTIIEMVHGTRLDTVFGSLGIMRAALAQAHHHVRHRRAFQRTLIDQPAMRGVIADLQLDYEAAAALAFRVAQAFDASGESERAFARLGVALAKYQLNKRAPGFVAECLECLGGGGYVEESDLPRLYREAPLNGIWEGSGNVIALDVLRTLARAPDAMAALETELAAATGADRRLDAAIRALPGELRAAADDEGAARRTCERIALTLQGALLVRHAPPATADAFCAARLAGDGGRAYGTLPGATDIAAVAARVTDGDA